MTTPTTAIAASLETNMNIASATAGHIVRAIRALSEDVGITGKRC